MNGNIVSLTPPEKRPAIVAAFTARLPEYSDDHLRAMFADSWRPSKVAAWVVAAQKGLRHRPEVARRLLQQPGYPEHFCICLARLGGEEALGALVAYLEGCATGSLQHGPHDETIGPEWALAAIAYLSPSRGADAERLWDAFLSRQVPLLREH